MPEQHLDAERKEAQEQEEEERRQTTLDEWEEAYDVLHSSLSVLIDATEKHIGGLKEPAWFTQALEEMYALRDFADWRSPSLIKAHREKYFVCRTCQQVTYEVGIHPNYCAQCSKSLGA